MLIKTLTLHSLTYLVGITSSMAVHQVIPPSGRAERFQSGTGKTAVVTQQIANRSIKSDRLPIKQSKPQVNDKAPVQFTAQVTENVYDSPTGRFLLIPQGARLIGIYDSQVAFGQSRVLLVWNRLIMPNGRSIVLERQAGADTAGYAGLEDEVDNHWGAQFKAALLSTLLGVGSELGTTTGTGNNADVITALRRGTSDSMNQTGQRAVQRNLNIQPTLTIRPGFPVRIIVNRDLVLEPYKG
jgi:type IV secretion system protein TrbI